MATQRQFSASRATPSSPLLRIDRHMATPIGHRAVKKVVVKNVDSVGSAVHVIDSLTCGRPGESVGNGDPIDQRTKSPVHLPQVELAPTRRCVIGHGANNKSAQWIDRAVVHPERNVIESRGHGTHGFAVKNSEAVPHREQIGRFGVESDSPNMPVDRDGGRIPCFRLGHMDQTTENVYPDQAVDPVIPTWAFPEFGPTPRKRLRCRRGISHLRKPRVGGRHRPPAEATPAWRSAPSLPKLAHTLRWRWDGQRGARRVRAIEGRTSVL